MAWLEEEAVLTTRPQLVGCTGRGVDGEFERAPIKGLLFEFSPLWQIPLMPVPDRRVSRLLEMMEVVEVGR